MKKNNIYPLKDKLLNFIDTLIHELEYGQDFTFPKELELENFAVKDFSYVSYFIEILHEPNESWRKFKVLLTDKEEFRREIYTDKSLQDIKRELQKLTDLNYILLVLAREEIFHYYNNPLFFIDLYQKFENINSNVKYNKILNIPDERANYFVKLFSSEENVSRSFIDDSLEHRSRANTIKSLYKQDFSLKNFINHKDFINNFVVYIFSIHEQRSTSRRDYWSIEKEYCLFHKGIRVQDEYINSLLPESHKESFDEYNDSTPGLVRKKEVDFKISYLETERFHEKYKLDKHLAFLSTRIDFN